MTRGCVVGQVTVLLASELEPVLKLAVGRTISSNPLSPCGPCSPCFPCLPGPPVAPVSPVASFCVLVPATPARVAGTLSAGFRQMQEDGSATFVPVPSTAAPVLLRHFTDP